MDLPLDRRTCPICESAAQVEVVIETKRGWGCYCHGCAKTFPVAKTDAERAEEREATP